MFESWFLFKQESDQMWIPITENEYGKFPRGISTEINIERVIRNFLQDSLYCGVLQFESSQYEEESSMNMMEFVDLKVRNNNWDDFSKVKVIRPVNPFDLSRHSFVFKLEFNNTKINSWISSLEKEIHRSVGLSKESSAAVEYYKKIFEKIICLASIEFEISNENEHFYKGMPEEDYQDSVMNEEEMIKKTFMKISCKSLKEKDDQNLPEWMIGFIENQSQIFSDIGRVTLRSQGTYDRI